MNRPRRANRPSRTALLLVLLGASLLSACGGGATPVDDDQVDAPDGSAPELAAEDPDATPAAPGSASEETTESAADCEITAEDDTCDDTAPQDSGLGTEEEYAELLSDAAALVGTPEDALPDDVRISRRGDEDLPVTDDYLVGRRTAQLDRDGSGTYVVTTVDLELPDEVVRLPPED